MFSEFKTLVQKQWKTLCESPQLYSIRITNGELFDTYLRAFPEQHRQHHNCNCCKSFLNNYGNLVAIKNGKILTLWDFSASDIYEDVPVYLRRALKDKSIEGPFISKQRGLGTDYNFEMIEEASHRWDHFFVTVPSSMVYSGTRTIDTVIGDFKTTQQVFTRSLETITLEALREVMDLIEQNALYRGKEFEGSLKNFYSLRTKYAALKTPREKDIFTWEFAKDGGRIRNTAIGTLVVDISEGKDIELAVKSFETIMAPANYRRPTTLVTPKMVQAAKNKIQELGFGDSLRRRHCFDTDVKVNNLLFVNRGVSHGDVFDSISSETPVNANSFKRAPVMTMEDFIKKLNSSSSVELLLERDHNFVSLLTAVDDEAPSMFSWGNPFSWTYGNNQTDAIKEKVKNAGGNINAELRISLEWFNYDDLDLHVTEPDGNKIWFSQKRSTKSSGFLDVDMNAGSGTTRTPVENIAFTLPRVQEGSYKVQVHQFSKRENVDFGFNIQIESQGNVIDLNHGKAVNQGVYVDACTFDYTKKNGVTNLKTPLGESQKISQVETNGLLTNRFQRVKMAMWSPNHWAVSKGNKHLFFILEGAKIEVPLRGFFNEYLSPALNEHRKVFEILGSKMLVEPSDNQLTGVGFSLTQNHEIVVKLDGKVTKVQLKEFNDVRESITSEAAV